MGKIASIKTLSKVIANTALHRLLLKYIIKPESKNHLEAEVLAYRGLAITKSNEFNWNDEDKEIIKQNSFKELKKRIRKYPEIEFKEEDLQAILDQTIKEILG